MTALVDGGFLVSGEAAGQDGNGYGIYGHRFDASGAPVTFASAAQSADITGSTLESVRLFGDIEAGDSYTLTLDDQDVTYTAVTGDTMTDVREQLVSAVNGAGLDVTATTGGGVNEVILSAGEGTSFALTATATVQSGSSIAHYLTIFVPPALASRATPARLRRAHPVS